MMRSARRGTLRDGAVALVLSALVACSNAPAAARDDGREASARPTAFRFVPDPCSSAVGAPTACAGRAFGSIPAGAAQRAARWSRAPEPSGRVRGTWLWDYELVRDPRSRAEVLAFVAERGTTALYLESTALLLQEPNVLRATLIDASARGVLVELLFGEASWALPPEHHVPLDLVRRAHDLADDAPVPPLGVHVDVEPHLLPAWSEDRSATTAAYLDLLFGLKRATRGTELALSVDIPAWFDELRVTRDDESRPLSEWVIDAADVTVLMDYQDHASGNDGIIAQASREAAYAMSVGKGIVLGVETACEPELSEISFCKQGARALEDALSETLAAYPPGRGVLGTAVHHYGSMRLLYERRVGGPVR